MRNQFLSENTLKVLELKKGYVSLPFLRHQLTRALRELRATMPWNTVYFPTNEAQVKVLVCYVAALIALWANELQEELAPIIYVQPNQDKTDLEKVLDVIVKASYLGKPGSINKQQVITELWLAHRQVIMVTVGVSQFDKWLEATEPGFIKWLGL